MHILVLNCGSSSLKYGLFNSTTGTIVTEGTVERIGETESVLGLRWAEGTRSMAVEAADHTSALMQVRGFLLDPAFGGVESADDIGAVGHRVVHGGDRFVRSALITDEVEHVIEDFSVLAPLHNPSNLAGVRAARDLYPHVPHVAVFDTAFHQTMPDEAYLYALPYELYEKDRVRRYGFHGTSHRHASQRASELLNGGSTKFTGITCHLGNGCSLAAIRNGESVDTSMGLTPLEGVPMGTRSGDLDPAILFHLAQTKGMAIRDLDDLLNRHSGLLGISGISNDLRELESASEKGNERAELAQRVFAYRVRKYIGAYLAVLGGAEAVVFTGGIGENGPGMRERILMGLDGIGLVLDPERNAAIVGREGEISADGSPIRIFVIHCREELLIARYTQEIVEGQKEALV